MHDEDLIKKLRLDPGTLATLKTAQPKSRRRAKGRFVVAELESLKTASKAVNTPLGLMVWLFIVYRTRLHRTHTVSVSNEALAKWGVERRAKYSALRQLEGAGLIRVERKGKRSPRVCIL
jgi:hypothetical protein